MTDGGFFRVKLHYKLFDIKTQYGLLDILFSFSVLSNYYFSLKSFLIINVFLNALSRWEQFVQKMSK